MEVNFLTIFLKRSFFVQFKFNYFRHWGLNSGDVSLETKSGTKYQSTATNKVLEVYGVAVAKVNDKFQIEDLEVFYDPSDSVDPLFKQSECPMK